MVTQSESGCNVNIFGDEPANVRKKVRKGFCLILNGCEVMLFESLDLSQIFVCGVV